MEDNAGIVPEKAGGKDQAGESEQGTSHEQGKPASLLSDDLPNKAETAGGSQDKGKLEEELVLNIPDEFKPLEKELGEYKNLAKEIGLNKEQAQRLLDHNHASFKAQAQIQLEAKAKQAENWAVEVKSDKEMGGANFEATVMQAKASLKAFDGDGKVFGLLEQSGYSNHPEIIRFLAKIGAAHGEDVVMAGGAKNEVPLWDRLYGKK